jgi:hypothetical protein
MTKLKWILRDCNIYIALFFIVVSFFPTIVVYQPLILCFAIFHILKIIKMIKDNLFLISDFNLMLALACFIPLTIDYHIKAYTFSLFLIVPISLKALLFTKISKITLNHYIEQNNISPEFIVIVENDLKNYLVVDHKSSISYYLYLGNVEFRLSDTFKGIYFKKKYIPFAEVKKYCVEHNIEYANINKNDIANMLNVSH